MEKDLCIMKMKARFRDAFTWFGIELKSFEISMEEVRGKSVGKIVDRGCGFSTWIRFGERGVGAVTGRGRSLL